MNILLIFSGFILAFIIVILYKLKIRRIEPRNKVYFYVAKDVDSTTYLVLCKRKRFGDYFVPTNHGTVVSVEDNLKNQLKVEDFKDLKWEDEPVEVFINLKD